ncbi:hypothetical protein DCAR_0521713 [Daucus carota subsp. sativus]|uniref:Uncharacterized protein n=1 Tax=Daucus carota subsp. sativus TaxID=79200 RepID=A0AAF0X8E7_DAUCS|nr:hypothetical protein DCAR_0521713 [Daucus carota subsp. sativus]
MGQQVRHLLQKRESTSGNHASPKATRGMTESGLFGYIIQVERSNILSKINF